MLKRMINVILSTFAIMLIVLPAFSATITVTSIEDSGAGTLRTALASASSGDTINFSTGGNSITVYLFNCYCLFFKDKNPRAYPASGIRRTQFAGQAVHRVRASTIIPEMQCTHYNTSN